MSISSNAHYPFCQSVIKSHCVAVSQLVTNTLFRAQNWALWRKKNEHFLPLRCFVFSRRSMTRIKKNIPLQSTERTLLGPRTQEVWKCLLIHCSSVLEAKEFVCQGGSNKQHPVLHSQGERITGIWERQKHEHTLCESSFCSVEVTRLLAFLRRVCNIHLLLINQNFCYRILPLTTSFTWLSC